MIAINVNQGGGTVPGSTEEQAIANMRIFVADCNIKGLRFVRVPELDNNNGRFGFLLWRENVCHTVEMPGIAIDSLRFMGEKHQKAYNYYRLYVDGSSWLWKFGLLDDPHDWEREG